MGFDFRLPNITGATEREQLLQVKSYLFSLVEQLQWAMNNIDTAPINSESTIKSKLAGVTGELPSKPQVEFSDLKALIIKSADIVDAYYEEINKRLQSIYVAQSDFGTFKEQNTHDIEENSTGIYHAFTNIQKIEANLQEATSGIGANIESLSDDVGQLDNDLQDAKTAIDTDLQDIKDVIESLSFSIAEATGRIEYGIIDYDKDELPIYGLEIGQINTKDGEEVFNKYARFTADRLSFYDQNGSEVAYVSDRKLYITHAEITATLKLGGYVVDTTRGLTVKWAGRG